MRRFYYTCGMLAAVLFASCVPERIVWSPDGTHAAIIGDDGLHLCDVAGKLSPSLVSGVKCAAWMPDSRRVVVSIQQEYKTWRDASRAFPTDAAVASKNVDVVRSQLLSAAAWRTFVASARKTTQLSNTQLALALMSLRDDSDQSLTKATVDIAEGLKAQTIVEDTVQLYELDGMRATAGTVLYHGVSAGGGIRSLRVSPMGTAVLLSGEVAIRQEDETVDLLLVPTDGSQKVRDLGPAAQYPDWSSDGKYVIYIQPTDWNGNRQQESSVGILTRQQVSQSDGQLLNQTDWPRKEELAGMLFGEQLRVRAARDGRIFFDALEISLPTAAKDIDPQPTIFCFEPGKQATLTRVIPRSVVQTMGDAAQYFELSPDARYLSIPFGDGRVSVLDLASGEAQIVQPDAKHEGDNKSELVSVPVWRTATELTFIRPVANSTAHEVVRYSMSDKTATVISGDWPQSVGLSAK